MAATFPMPSQCRHMPRGSLNENAIGVPRLGTPIRDHTRRIPA